jgi:hypothetical protein
MDDYKYKKYIGFLEEVKKKIKINNHPKLIKKYKDHNDTVIKNIKNEINNHKIKN